MKEVAILELYKRKVISLEEISRVEPRVMLVPMFLLEFFLLGGFMERILSDLEKIVLLERKIGMMLDKSGSYLDEVLECERKRASIALNIMHYATLDELYAVYIALAKEPKDELKMEKILAIIDLIDNQMMSIERGR